LTSSFDIVTETVSKFPSQFSIEIDFEMLPSVFNAGSANSSASIVPPVKTSTGIWDEYFLQCAAYAEAVRHVHGEAVEGAWILRFDKKTGEFEAAKSKDIAADDVLRMDMIEW